jgi:hypothetical protein
MQHSGLIHYSNFYYSQSGIRDVRNFCKNKKIIEVQFSIPMKNINQLSNLFLMINKFIKPITCSIKILGDDVNQNNLSFYQYGLSINFDFPMDRLNTKKLNEIYIEIIKLGGKVNLSKDSQISEEMFKSMYPEYPNWLKVVKKIDPFNYFQSAMSKRLQIK